MQRKRDHLEGIEHARRKTQILTMEDDYLIWFGFTLGAPYYNVPIAIGTGHMTRVDPAHGGDYLEVMIRIGEGKRDGL